MKKNLKNKKTSLNDVMGVIGKWAKDNKSNVVFCGGFIDVKEVKIIAFGKREDIKTMFKEFSNEFKKDKNKFINW